MSTGGRVPQPYLYAVAVVAVCTGVSALLRAPFDLGNVVAVYLLGVMVVAARSGRGPAVLASVLGALAFDFLFVPPAFGLVPERAAHLLTFVIMLAVAMTVSTMAARLREQLQQAEERERHTALLYGLARDLARAGDAAAVASAVESHVRQRFGCGAVLWTDRAAADAAAATPGLHLPLRTANGEVGVLGVVAERAGVDLEAQRAELEHFANQAAIALERTLLADAAQRAAIDIEQERLRSTLLSSVSHDLRTPIASIIGAASTLLRDQPLDPATRRDLLEGIHQEGARLERQVRNLLYMTRLEAGTVHVSCDWTPVEEVVGAALTRLEDLLRGREVATRLAADLPPVPMDGMLIEQVLLNLLENALRYTPPGTPIEIAVRPDGGQVRIEVMDRGPGIGAADRERLFDRFHSTASSGLGLSICGAIASLHGGRVDAANRDGGGAVFGLVLPLQPPAALPPLRLGHDGGER